MRLIMRKLILACLLTLLGAIGIRAQSTTVSGTATDNASQAWIGGSYSFKSLSPQQPNIPATPGLLDNTGSFSGVVIPHNSYTASVSDVWTLTICPDVSIPATGNGCFTANVTIQGPTQSLTSIITPPAPSLTIPLYPAGISTIRAYNDTEITYTPKGGQYYNVITPANRVCTTVAGSATLPTCTTWANVGGGTGPGGLPRLDQVLNPNVSKTFDLGTTTLAFINGTLDLSSLTAAVKLPVIAGCTVASAGQICYDSTLGNWEIYNTAASFLPTLLQSGTYTTNDVLGIKNVAGKITLIDLGPVNGGSGSSFVQVTTTNILNGDQICWNASGNNWINCTPGIPVTTITATSYTVNCATDRGSYLLFTAATAISISLPQAGSTTACGANLFLFMRTITATATVTPVTSTINDGGGANATLVMSPGYGFTITSDNTNYTARGGPYRESGNPLMSVEGFDVQTAGGYDWQAPNNASPGTAVNKMACDDGTGKLQTCPFATSTTNDPVGIATTGIGAAPGTTGNTDVCFIGFCQVIFDNAATSNHFAQLSTTVNGDLHDTGSATAPTNSQPYWYIFAGNSGAGTIGTVRNLAPRELSATGNNGGGKTTVQINGTGTQPVVNFTTSGGLTLTPTNSGNTTTVAFTVSGTGGYATIENAGAAVTQRTTLNFLAAGSANIQCIDNSGATRTDCTVTGINGPPSPTVQTLTGSTYTVQNSDNTWRSRLTNAGATGITLPQPNTIAVSPFIATRYFSTPTSGTTVTTGNYAQTAGDDLIVLVGWNGSTTVVGTPTDTAGDTFTRISADITNIGPSHQSMSTWKAHLIAASASSAFTIVFSGTTATTIAVEEYNLLNFDNNAGASNAGTGGSMTTTIPVSYSQAVAIGFLQAQDTLGCPQGYTNRGTSSTTAVCEKLLSSSSSVLFNFPIVADAAVSQLADWQIASAPTFTAGWFTTLEGFGANNVSTITPTSSTINGQTTLVTVPNEWCAPMSDGTNYNAICGFVPNVTTNGVMGGAVEVAGVNSSSLNADVGTATLITTGAANAFYTVDADVNCDSAVSTGVATLTITFTDTSSTVQTYTTSAACTTLGSSSIGSIRQAFRAKASTNIQYGVAHTGTQPTYDVSVAVNQLSTK
jgi:hypothetical protein